MDRQLAKYLFANEVLFTSGLAERPAINAIKSESLKKGIVSESTPAKEAIPDSPIFKATKSILILVEKITTSQTELLEKILGALKLSLSDVDLINLSEIKITNLNSILDQGVSKKVINFGVSNSTLLLNSSIQKYQKKQEPGYLFLESETLEVIEKNQNEEKKLLWNSLKDLFSI